MGHNGVDAPWYGNTFSVTTTNICLLRRWCRPSGWHDNDKSKMWFWKCEKAGSTSVPGASWSRKISLNGISLDDIFKGSGSVLKFFVQRVILVHYGHILFRCVFLVLIFTTTFRIWPSVLFATVRWEKSIFHCTKQILERRPFLSQSL